MVRPLDESQGSSPLQGCVSWLVCEVALVSRKQYQSDQGAWVPKRHVFMPTLSIVLVQQVLWRGKINSLDAKINDK